ncbi:IS4 family transposase [Lachnospiraceae bacterium C1.1]|nr:IS4 family transposase [Lachnospiraceae bacterium C1.1]
MDWAPGIASIIREMPEGYEEACFETGAIVRKRDIKNPDDLMMLDLFHLMTGCSLVEISTISTLAEIGDISDVAFMKRFKNCNEWFKWIIDKVVSEGLISYDLPNSIAGFRVLAIDASDVVEKGRSARTYRLHFALDIKKMHAALYNITTNKVGEKLSNFSLSEGDLVLADRAYGTANSILHCNKCNADYILRLRANGLSLCDENGNKINLYEHMADMETGDYHCFAKTKDNGLLPIRICFSKKDPDALKKTQKRLHKRETKRQFVISDETKAFNEYIVVITSLPDSVTTTEVLDAYRYRWQVELYFKRLKSILNYGELPKKTEESIFAWLNGKLMIALLMEKIIGRVSFSPTEESFEEYLERDEVYEALADVQ